MSQREGMRWPVKASNASVYGAGQIVFEGGWGEIDNTHPFEVDGPDILLRIAQMLEHPLRIYRYNNGSANLLRLCLCFEYLQTNTRSLSSRLTKEGSCHANRT